MLSKMAIPVAFSTALGSSPKKIIAKINVVPDAIILQDMALATDLHAFSVFHLGLISLIIKIRTKVCNKCYIRNFCAKNPTELQFFYKKITFVRIV